MDQAVFAFTNEPANPQPLPSEPLKVEESKNKFVLFILSNCALQFTLSKETHSLVEIAVAWKQKAPSSKTSKVVNLDQSIFDKWNRSLNSDQ